MDHYPVLHYAAVALSVRLNVDAGLLTVRKAVDAWLVCCQEFLVNDEGHVTGVSTVLVDWTKDATGRWVMKQRPGTVCTVWHQV